MSKPDHPRPPSLPDEFWDLIDLARENRDGYRAHLRRLSRDELIRWYWTYDRAAGWLRDSPYVEHMDPGLSGDGIDDVAQWVVAQGRVPYLDVIDHPEHVPREIDRHSTVLGDIVLEYRRRFHAPVPLEWEG